MASPMERLEVYYGSQTLTTNFTGYKLVNEHTDEVVSEGGTEDSLFQNDLHAFWINVPPGPDTAAGIGALEHLFRVGAMFVIPADRFDTSTYSKTSGEPTAFYYENYRRRDRGRQEIVRGVAESLGEGN